MERNLGDEQRGQDGDVGSAGLTEKKVDARSGYFDNLKERLGHRPKPVSGRIEHEPDVAPQEPQEPEKPTFVIYGDDGKPI